MPDIRTLLDDATARAPHPDPVTAVHRTVRRRAARRRTVVAAGTTFAVASAGVVYAGRSGLRPAPPAASLSPTSSATATPGPPDPSWRIQHSGQSNWPAAFWAAYQRVRDDAEAHPDAYVYLASWTVETDWTIMVGIAGDVDQDQWEARIRQLAGDAAVRPVHCRRSTATYDRIRTELADAAWPSGDHVAGVELVEEPMGGPCAVVAEMSHSHDERDKEYARQRWGGDVVLLFGAVHEVLLPNGSTTIVPVP
jgi:hypothetical protein